VKSSYLLSGPSGEIYTGEYNNIVINGACQGVIILTNANQQVLSSYSNNIINIELPTAINGKTQYLLLSGPLEMTVGVAKLFTDGINQYTFNLNTSAVTGSDMVNGGFSVFKISEAIPLSYFENNGWISEGVINFKVWFVPFFNSYLNITNIFCF
jgi:hypothetical protein